jgi:predicted GIY-YIG superfamily endonuclease
MENSKKNAFYVYLLECSDHSTYVGATVDLYHRLRQHRGEIKGGARVTTMKIKQGYTWERILYITGFPDWKAALQFEWAFKFYSRKYPKYKNPLERRMRGLYDIIHMDRPTSNAILYEEWTNEYHGPEIIWENENSEYKKIYESLLLEK